ncbi:phosphoglycerate kinase [Buchnera aphidicola]|uniref:Phosphoglycerate kinase n=1 Tax=Buchnera aphidicola (Sarucallis kahawaluokalani) TaxID=1241878 RepID=A0A4D6YA91_9GAMM|nr:phosphoglycerate kinase [Buchnera aphidicola]QCI26082.1 phosphoglycerate kinase [Buchnera aphidicola (Sarucallis kahawaluokalani)]
MHSIHNKNIIHMTDLDLNKKKVLIRVDFNVPIKNNQILSDDRIQASIPTINFALKKNAKVILMSHIGRPKEGQINHNLSITPIVKYLKKIFHKYNVYFSKSLQHVPIKPGELLILENVRFNIGEKTNDSQLSKKYAELCDIFVMDAFGSAHRKEASTYGVGLYAKIACAGPLLVSEINALTKALQNPQRPMVSIVGGAKISTKFQLLKKLSMISDIVIVGGGIANTFLAIDYNIGKSLHEKKFIPLAKKLRARNNILIPVDSRIGTEFSDKSIAINKKPSEIKENEEIMDIGNKSIKKITQVIQTAKTILWNGPMGVFEFKNFSIGTRKLAKSIAISKAFSIAGGGETINVINMFDIKNNISYISTGGGAFLEFAEGTKLPAIHMLELSKKKHNINNTI